MVNIYILPVSGGAFVSQLAAIQHLSINNIKPDIFLASSGGNLASYIAACSDNDPNMIEFTASKLSSSIFLTQWSYSKLLSSIIGYFQGSLNSSGEGAYKFLTECFVNKEKLEKYEIWTGVYNTDKKKGQYFCNKDKSILDTSIINLNLYRILPFQFCNCVLKDISDVSLASASIPAIVPAVLINGDNYVDGGVSKASPLSIMTDSIFLLAEDNPIHMFYINPIDVDNICVESNNNNMLDAWKDSTDDMVESNTISDRYSCVSLLEKIALKKGRDIFFTEGEINNLQEIKEIQKKALYSVLELYPSKYQELIITNFNGEDVVTNIREAFKNIKYRFWYIISKSSN